MPEYRTGIYWRLLRFAMEHIRSGSIRNHDWTALKKDGRYTPSDGTDVYEDPQDYLGFAGPFYDALGKMASKDVTCRLARRDVTDSDKRRIKYYDKMIGMDPDYDLYDVRCDKVRLLTEIGMYEKALECYDMMIYNDMSDKIDPVEGKAGLLERLGRYDEALECYGGLPREVGHSLDDFLRIGTSSGIQRRVEDKAGLLERLGRYDEALECYDWIMTNSMHDNTAILKKAHLLYRMGDYKKGMECFVENRRCMMFMGMVTDLNPVWEPMSYMKGLFHAQIGRYEDAIRYYDEVPDDSAHAALAADILTAKGDVLADLGRNKKAVECYDGVLEIIGGEHMYRVCALNPDSSIEYNNADVLSRKISVLYDLGEYDEALRCYDMIIGRQSFIPRTTYHPESGMVAFAKVLFLDEIGRHEEAAEFYDEHKSVFTTQDQVLDE